MSPSVTPTESNSNTAGPVARFVVLTLLAVDGVLSAVAAAFLLPSYLGPVPFPVSALISGLVNAALVWAARYWTDSPRIVALPLWTWLLAVAAMTFGGPADDTIFGGRGLMGYGVLLLIVFGAGPPGWVLWHRKRVLEEREQEVQAALAAESDNAPEKSGDQVQQQVAEGPAEVAEQVSAKGG